MVLPPTPIPVARWPLQPSGGAAPHPYSRREVAPPTIRWCCPPPLFPQRGGSSNHQVVLPPTPIPVERWLLQPSGGVAPHPYSRREVAPTTIRWCCPPPLFPQRGGSYNHQVVLPPTPIPVERWLLQPSGGAAPHPYSRREVAPTTIRWPCPPPLFPQRGGSYNHHVVLPPTPIPVERWPLQPPGGVAPHPYSRREVAPTTTRWCCPPSYSRREVAPTTTRWCCPPPLFL